MLKRKENNYTAMKAMEAMREMQRISKLNGNSEMTLEEINAEIYAARREMEARAARMRLAGAANFLSRTEVGFVGR